jgi:hypothetical protein
MLLRQHCPDDRVFCHLRVDLDGLSQCDAWVAVPKLGSGGA